MKKLVSIIGSHKGYNSKTYDIAYKVSEGLKNKNNNISSEFFILSELDINKCTGCLGCFTKCSSCVIFNDSMSILEKSMFDADIIIFGSPVYAHNITGDMKIFIDRLCHLLHIMGLCGKYGVTVSTSSSNGNTFVDNYLFKIMEYLGIRVVDQISYVSYHKFEDKHITKCVDKIDGILNNKILLPPSEFQEQIFNIYKKIYFKSYEESIINKNVVKNQEACYWHDNGYFNYNSFEELFNIMKNK
ncbi:MULTISPECIES: flavodoxin family protein [Clostridium]|uniref:flavodoxin family protein n=1 Tax=Clostridium TaxID=1485 RepID=UPI000DFC3D82|nr:flavodoxin family protein [Clostridium sporogenes]MCW6086521.1 flavodoxin family protein [Clostridium sporogenes]STE73772.1 4Fe-4S ferredoxin-domain protein (NADPH-dependent FMN reductase family) [Clostridium botulinum]